MELSIEELKKTLKRKDAMLLMLLVLWPALVSVGIRSQSGFFILEGIQVGALEFCTDRWFFSRLYFFRY